MFLDRQFDPIILALLSTTGDSFLEKDEHRRTLATTLLMMQMYSLRNFRFIMA